MAAIDNVRADYIAGLGSYRQLAEKYGVPLRTIAARAKKEKWQQRMQQCCNSAATAADTAIAEQIASRQSECDLTVYEVSMELLQKTRASISAADEMSSGDASRFASALRSLKLAMERPSDLDIEEQRARIDRLRAEIERQSDDDEPVAVTFVGGDAEDWAT